MPYTNLVEISRGGMGVVYKGIETRQGLPPRPVAIKMMSNKLTSNATYRTLFHAEVQSLLKMTHPGVVHIVGQPYADSLGNYYLPMEFVDGETLESLVRHHGPLSVRAAALFMIDILDALSYVHRHGVVHRDLKPSNIMIRRDNSGSRICIIDFGIAQDALRSIAGNNVVIGTLNYMSPEQATQGAGIDHRTDIYSIGCVLYYMLTGRDAVPESSDSKKTCLSIRNGISTPPSAHTGVSTTFDAICAKATAVNMLQRYQSVAEFKKAILAAVPDILATCDSISVGRNATCDIVIDDPRHVVSGHHLDLRPVPVTGGPWRIEIVDHSSNGTSVDGTRLCGATRSVRFGAPVLLAGHSAYPLDWQRVADIFLRRDRIDIRSSALPPHPGPHPPAPPVPPVPPVPPSGGSLGFGMVVLCFLCPILGWILAGVWSQRQPRKSSAAFAAAWWGFGVSLTFTVVMLAILASAY